MGSEKSLMQSIAASASIGGGSSLIVQDEGSTLTPAATKINFAGAGVVATQPSPNEILVTIPGGTGPTQISPVDTISCGPSSSALSTASVTLTVGVSDKIEFYLVPNDNGVGSNVVLTCGTITSILVGRVQIASPSSFVYAENVINPSKAANFAITDTIVHPISAFRYIISSPGAGTFTFHVRIATGSGTFMTANNFKLVGKIV